MNLRSNAHCHTVYCDGKNTPEEMVLAALARDFVSLGLSIHGWTPFDPTSATPGREAAYRAELRRLQAKYAGRIEILAGAEREALFPREFSGYDFIIDSIHWLLWDGEYLCVDKSAANTDAIISRCFGGDPYAYCRAYYARQAEVCARTDAAFIGHFDLVRKFNRGNARFDESDPRYLRPALEALEVAVRRGLPIEINTGALYRGHRDTPYPHPALLRRVRELGGEVIINSDAHAAVNLDAGFDAAVEIARACGFGHVLRLRAARFEEVPLARG